MKKITTLLLIAVTVFTMSCNNETKEVATEVVKEEVKAVENTLESKQYMISNKESVVAWSGTGVGHGHNGTINVAAGKIAVENGAIVKAKLSLDMTSINATDVEGEDKTKLDKHLKDADFFNVTEFPMANLEITDATDINNVKANLTIKDVTKEIIFPMSVSVTEGVATITSKFEFDRTIFGVTYNSGNFFKDLGDYMIDDVIKMDIKLIAK